MWQLLKMFKRGNDLEKQVITEFYGKAKVEEVISKVAKKLISIYMLYLI